MIFGELELSRLNKNRLFVHINESDDNICGIGLHSLRWYSRSIGCHDLHVIDALRFVIQNGTRRHRNDTRTRVNHERLRCIDQAVCNRSSNLRCCRIDRAIHIDFGRSDRIFDNSTVIDLSVKFRTILDICHENSKFHIVVQVRENEVAIGILCSIANSKRNLVRTLRLVIQDYTFFRIDDSRLGYIENCRISVNGDNLVVRQQPIGIKFIRICKLYRIFREHFVFGNFDNLFTDFRISEVRHFVDIGDGDFERVIIGTKHHGRGDFARFNNDRIRFPRHLPFFVIKSLDSIFHFYDTGVRIDFEQIGIATFNGVDKLIVFGIRSLDLPSNRFRRIFRDTQFYLIQIHKHRRCIVDIHKLNHKASVKLIARKDGSVQVRNLEHHKFITFAFFIQLYLDVRRNQRLTITLINGDVFDLIFRAQRHRMRFVSKIQIFKSSKRALFVLAIAVILATRRINIGAKESKAVIKGDIGVCSIRQIEIHRMPFGAFLKQALGKHVRVDFWRVERDIVEFSAKFRFEPKCSSGNQLTSNANIVCNSQITCCNIRSLIIRLLIAIHGSPRNIRIRIEQEITGIIGIRHNCYCGYINGAAVGFFPRTTIPFCSVIDVSNLNLRVICRTTDINTFFCKNTRQTPRLTIGVLRS